MLPLSNGLVLDACRLAHCRISAAQIFIPREIIRTSWACTVPKHQDMQCEEKHQTSRSERSPHLEISSYLTKTKCG